MANTIASPSAWAPRLGPLLVIALSAGALAVAFVAQYGFDLLPCALCVWQRWAYGAALALGVAALAFGGREGPRRLALALGGLAFLIGAGIAFYHVGIEQQWWAGAEGCQGAGISSGMSRDDVRFAILNAPRVACDEVPWSLWGLSIAGFNALFSLGFAAIALGFALAGRGHRGGRADQRLESAR